MADTKSMTLRLDADRAAELEVIARADDMPISEAARQAIDRHIEARRNDKAFQERLSRFIEEEKDVLERLAR